ncbi:MAG TPA: D-2-hydroxyacid dehydrogenase [Terriglobales bacterium]|nr:D-2-hydroxyacid dehydrogenase [Terriglobales bacterium]
MKVLTVLHHRFDLWTAPSWFSERLARAFPDIEFEQFDDYTAAEPHLPQADVIVTWSLHSEQVQLANRLRWIHSPAAAVHQLMIPEIVNSDIVITNASSVHGPVVAEHVIAVVMTLAKRLRSAFRYQQQHVWSQQELWNERPRPREIGGATLGVVGLGSIGGEVARRALALGMKVVAVREHPDKELPEYLRAAQDFSSSQYGNDPGLIVCGSFDLDRMLSESDYVVLAAPLRENTKALMNAERIAKMRREAYLVNVARGQLVDEQALAEALREGRIAGAALDVFEHEPLSADSPLWDMPNVLITPHSAALTERLWERHYELVVENLKRFLVGRPLTSVVDKMKGY